MSGKSRTIPKKDAIRIWRRPYGYALALAVLGGGVIAYLLLAVDHSVSTRSKLSQVGAGLAASVIFGAVYSALADREHTRLVKAEIAESLNEYLEAASRQMRRLKAETTESLTGHLETAAQQISQLTVETTQSLNDHREVTLRQICQLNDVFLPTAQYPASKDFDRRFNKDLTDDLCNSDFYFFRGTSAKYVPARLRKCDHHLNKAQVILLDPREKSAIEARVADRRRRPGSGTKSYEELVADVKDEIFYALVALFDCRDRCKIEIRFSSVTSPVRVELFQDAIYTSFYGAPQSQRSEHPETVRFSSRSQMYQIFRDEFRRQLQLMPLSWEIAANHTERDLCNFINTLGAGEVGEDRIVKWRHAYQEFIGPFNNSLSEIGCQQ